MSSFQRIRVRKFLFFFASLLLVHLLALAQDNFLYTNNNDYFTANTVSGYLVSSDGSVAQLPSSPFSTRGTGNGGNGFIAANRITVCSKFLYASNDYSGNVSGFSINSKTGDLIAVPDSPFATGESSDEGIAVAVSPSCKFLFAANLSANELFAFSIEKNGRLVAVNGSPFSVGDQPNTIAASPDGAFLAVAYDGYVGMYGVGIDGFWSPYLGLRS